MLNPRQGGVTLVEMMIGLVIVAILLFAAVPSFSIYLHNQRLRAQAQSINAGLQLARAEAVKRNARVEMVFTNNDPIAALVNSVVSSTTGSNWIVRQFDATTTLYNFIEGRESNTGSGIFNDTRVQVSSTSAIIGFNQFGNSTLGVQSTISVTNPALGACAPSGVTRCLNIVVSAGGQVRMCDPDTTLNSWDPRKC